MPVMPFECVNRVANETQKGGEGHMRAHSFELGKNRLTL